MSPTDSGVVTIASRHAVATTLDRLEAALRERAVQIFARIDFTADAARTGLTMRPEQLLIFGNPRAGTPLMQAMPSVGLDLPLKALAFEAADGQVWIAYNDPRFLVQRHGLADALAANLAPTVPLIERAAAA